jgi:hypothetical protein
MVASRNRAWLNEGVMTLMRGQALPSAVVSESSRLPSVHGQPVRPAGAGGRSAKLARIKSASFFEISCLARCPAGTEL